MRSRFLTKTGDSDAAGPGARARQGRLGLEAVGALEIVTVPARQLSLQKRDTGRPICPGRRAVCGTESCPQACAGTFGLIVNQAAKAASGGGPTVTVASSYYYNSEFSSSRSGSRRLDSMRVP